MIGTSFPRSFGASTDTSRGDYRGSSSIDWGIVSSSPEYPSRRRTSPLLLTAMIHRKTSCLTSSVGRCRRSPWRDPKFPADARAVPVPCPNDQVGCGDREAKRALVSALLLLTPPLDRDSAGAPVTPPPRDLARISAISLRGDCALLEVPVEGSLSARAWLTSTSRPSVEGLVASAAEIKPAVMSERGVGWREKFQVEVWAIMLQALRGLVAVHAFSDKATHRGVCLENILVAASPRSVPTDGEADGSAGAHGPPAPPRGFLRRAQLGPPAPAALARPAPESVAPEVLRGQPFSQAADVYAFGFALRLACCTVGGATDDVGASEGDKNPGSLGKGGGAGGGAPSVMGPEAGPPPGPFRDSLVQVLESMLALDPSRRCTAEQARLLVHCRRTRRGRLGFSRRIGRCPC